MLYIIEYKSIKRDTSLILTPNDSNHILKRRHIQEPRYSISEKIYKMCSDLCKLNHSHGVMSMIL